LERKKEKSKRAYLAGESTFDDSAVEIRSCCFVEFCQTVGNDKHGSSRQSNIGGPQGTEFNKFGTTCKYQPYNYPSLKGNFFPIFKTLPIPTQKLNSFTSFALVLSHNSLPFLLFSKQIYLLRVLS
jgi:hypothetical protein